MTEFIEKNSSKIVIMILIFGILLRFIFIQTKDITQFQYDTGFTIQSKAAYEKVFERSEEVMLRYRHLDYIMIIFLTSHLPKVNSVQLYHPPLHHIISATFLKLINNFNISAYDKLETLQILPFIYSSMILIFSYCILKELGIKDKYKIISLIIIAIYPLNIYLSGMINNDALMTMFSVISILYIIKWYKNPSIKNAIIIAISIGLGMLTKTSIMVSVGIAGIVFLMKLFEMLLKDNIKDIKKIILEGIIFFIIVIPMGLAFPIRNYKLFGQTPFGIITANDDFQIKEGSFFERWGVFNKDILNNTLGYKDQNVPSYVIKSSAMFSVEREYDSRFELLLKVNKMTNIIIIMISILSMISLLINKSIESKNLIYILMITTVLWILSFIMFNISCPASCTMHARYIFTPIIMNLLIISADFNFRKYNKIYKTFTYATIILFCLTSIFIPYI